jgi:hypothetical protein
MDSTIQAVQAFQSLMLGAAGKTSSIGSNLSNSGAFNGASGRVSGSSIMLKATGQTDPGIALELKHTVSGKLTFNASGTVKGGFRQGKFTIIFLSSDGSTQLKECAVDPKKKSQNITIPSGTKKINIMLVGTGNINITLTGVSIVK